jgi:hypothetical protein
MLLPPTMLIMLDKFILQTKLKKFVGIRMHYLDPILILLVSLIVPFIMIVIWEFFYMLISLLISPLIILFIKECDFALEENFSHNYVVKNERIKNLFLLSFFVWLAVITISTFLDFLGIKLYLSVIYWYIDGFLSFLFGVAGNYFILIRIFFHSNSIDYHLKMARLYFKATLESLNKQGEPPLKVLKFLNKGINYYNKFLIHLLKIRISDDVNLLVSLAFMNKAEKISYIEKALNLLKDNVICIKDFLILTSNVVNKPFVQLIMKPSRFENAKHYLELTSYIVSWFLAIISIINLVKSFL